MQSHHHAFNRIILKPLRHLACLLTHMRTICMLIELAFQHVIILTKLLAGGVRALTSLYVTILQSLYES